MKFDNLVIIKKEGEKIDLSKAHKGRLEIFFQDGSWNYYDEKGKIAAASPYDEIAVKGQLAPSPTPLEEA